VASGVPATTAARRAGGARGTIGAGTRSSASRTRDAPDAPLPFDDGTPR
jgi:hypothetical protein